MGASAARRRFSISAATGPVKAAVIWAYIKRLASEKGSEDWRARARRQTRFHGRVEGRAQPCAEPGCDAPGEFRAPGAERPGFDGPGEWRWLCLDHVRAFNAGYNCFQGMSADEISAAQNPYGGWDRETRAFGTAGGSPARAGPISSIRSTRSAPASRRRCSSAGARTGAS